jgi:hypothetical protein
LVPDRWPPRRPDPLHARSGNRAIEDEEIREEETRAVAASKAWLAEHLGEGISHEGIMAEF